MRRASASFSGVRELRTPHFNGYRIKTTTRSPASAGIANRPLVFLSGHNIEYLCLNLFTLRRFNNNESSGGRQILLPLLGGDAPRLG